MIKMNLQTDKMQGTLIKDHRDNRYYFEESAGIVRIFETVMAETISRNDAIVKVAEDAGVAYTDVQLIY
jgi:hypothetical protein